LFSGVDLSKLTEAVADLTAAFSKCVPKSQRGRTNEAEWTRALAKFFAEADAIRLRYSLGFIGRARVAYLFQRRLLESGLDAETVRKVVFSLAFNSFSSKK
jgi:hypothetical protein